MCSSQASAVGAKIGIAEIVADHGACGYRSLARSHVGKALVDGAGSAGLGVVLDASAAGGSFDIRNFSATGSKGPFCMSPQPVPRWTSRDGELCSRVPGVLRGAGQRGSVRVNMASTGQEGVSEHQAGVGNLIQVTTSGPGKGAAGGTAGVQVNRLHTGTSFLHLT